jgi:hypothetical protein
MRLSVKRAVCRSSKLRASTGNPGEERSGGTCGAPYGSLKSCLKGRNARELGLFSPGGHHPETSHNSSRNLCSKQCLGMPIQNSDTESASQPPLHSNSSCQLNNINGESNSFRGDHGGENIYTSVPQSHKTMIQALLKQCSGKPFTTPSITVTLTFTQQQLVTNHLFSNTGRNFRV